MTPPLAALDRKVIEYLKGVGVNPDLFRPEFDINRDKEGINIVLVLAANDFMEWKPEHDHSKCTEFPDEKYGEPPYGTNARLDDHQETTVKLEDLDLPEHYEHHG